MTKQSTSIYGKIERKTTVQPEKDTLIYTKTVKNKSTGTKQRKIN